MVNFPLRIWEQSQAYQTARMVALLSLARIEPLLRERGFKSDLEIAVNRDGKFCANITVLDQPIDTKDRRELLEHARTYGSTGMWSFEDLETFVGGTGPILIDGMRSLGYGIAPRSGAWKSFYLGKESERPVDSPAPALPAIPVIRLASEQEAVRLQSRDIPGRYYPEMMGKAPQKLEQSFIQLSVGSEGMIRVYRIGQQYDSSLARIPELRNPGSNFHISPEQAGYTLQAEAVRMREKGPAYVCITCTSDSGDKIERLWPDRIALENIVTVATELNDDMQKSNLVGAN